MIKIYEKLKFIAETEYNDIVTSAKILGKGSIGFAKLRIFFNDHSFLDIWLSASGKYFYHWERSANIDTNPTIAIKQILDIVKEKLMHA